MRVQKIQSLQPFPEFLKRLFRYTSFALIIIGFSLGIGVLGYHYFNDLSWLDSLLNASMILTGMGPVDVMKTDSAKWFASFYAIFSGVVFLSTVAIFLTPLVHRFLHSHHLDDEAGDEK
ncbi:hypothetical protein BH09BAC3_BH09BAC3_17090 [soil metagenome]